jgi:uncharacterized membrane protein YbhN (UPF0104 family)
MPAAQSHTRRNRRLKLIYIIVCLVGLYGIVPQLNDFHHGFSLWRHLSLLYLAALLISCVLTYAAAGATYTLLSFKPLRYFRTVLVETASMFVNRLLPAGVGGIGANYSYLRKSKSSVSEASTTVAVNNTLGFIGHLLIVAVLLLTQPRLFKGLHVPQLNNGEELIALIVVIALFSSLALFPTLRIRMKKGLGSFFRQVTLYRHRRINLLAALGSSVFLTLANVSGLWFSCLALGIHLSFWVIVVVFTLGIGVGTVTPTPGGVGGIEAGMVAGLVAYHSSAATALAIVLLYRLVSFWLALVVGAIAFAVVKKRRYL